VKALPLSVQVTLQSAKLGPSIQSQGKKLRLLCTASVLNALELLGAQNAKQYSQVPVTACLRSKGHAIKSLIVRTEVALSHAVVGEDLHAMNRSFTDRLVVGCGEHAAGCKNLRRMTELLALPIADRNCVDGMRRKMWSSKRRVDCFDVDWVRGTV
jgi:hypothetical protein